MIQHENWLFKNGFTVFISYLQASLKETVQNIKLMIKT